MRWLLAGCCGLALISISVASDSAEIIIQKPRFYGVPVGRNLGIYCVYTFGIAQSVSVEWYKADKYDELEKKNKLTAENNKIRYTNTSVNQMAILQLHKVNIKDSGVYFCKMNNKWGPGTAVQVARPLNEKEALHRTRMKDGLIILQGLVLAVCVAALLLRKQRLWEKRDSIYEEPETDHIYEGLAIETCGGGLYEELSVYAEAEVAEAPWE
ncbi:uncharacterized protein cd79b isoform X2 [Epinephelus moara]|uniref:uncharacterized protein cd79b isoform X2 n=1 Tax=Epinephelus moara TaxID=300413 RepID=UPI00214E8645|nr:uncharacterized protein cd79b isoform X2 [Epinephelus moara]